MPDFEIFLWDEFNRDHIAQHGIAVEEFEFVVLNAKKTDVSRTSQRPIVFGVTLSGRKIACVYEVIDRLYCYPVTAYEVD